MDKLYKYPINSNQKLSNKLLKIGISNFEEALSYIQKLPYGRNSNRSDYTLILKEQKGTCSTKHAFLAEIAKQNNIPDVKLYIGIYKMCEENTQGVGTILSKWNLHYIPEAHCYLKINNNIIDITRTSTNISSFTHSILQEEEIIPSQIGNYKVNVHQAFLKEWILKESISFSFESLWDIREACIKNLDQ
ncbi:hypothetical protein [Xanthomarina sp. F2636L]|uniref:hypothetical protein n=1 Tax=Xanthomarina sp. F2636L TaxID=2996018 RepID=UPI00225E1794|nr:hypothetical protein [Xanthomarina sp. F2636L]MCX7549779.1 hypothetical protein [Xanthomarina sp. F2636L]